jgi:hypothetical protein
LLEFAEILKGVTLDIEETHIAAPDSIADLKNPRRFIPLYFLITYDLLINNLFVAKIPCSDIRTCTKNTDRYTNFIARKTKT